LTSVDTGARRNALDAHSPRSIFPVALLRLLTSVRVRCRRGQCELLRGGFGMNNCEILYRQSFQRMGFVIFVIRRLCWHLSSFSEDFSCPHYTVRTAAASIFPILSRPCVTSSSGIYIDDRTASGVRVVLHTSAQHLESLAGRLNHPSPLLLAWTYGAFAAIVRIGHVLHLSLFFFT